MMNSSRVFPSHRAVLSACALACVAAACSAPDGDQTHDAARRDSQAMVDDGGSDDVQSPDDDAGIDAQAPDDDADLDAQTDDDATGMDESAPTDDADMDAGAPMDAARMDAARMDAAPDAHAPAAPHCHTGDRTEWSGTVPSTLIAVSVCSTCGRSYVVAASGASSTGQVTVNNGSTTIMSNVPAGGTATTAQIADNPSNGRVTVCATTGTHGCLPVQPQNQEYCNPFRSIAHLTSERIDQGVDYAGSGPIYALGPGTINVYHNRNDSGWPGGTFVSYRISAGPAAGRDIYLAENIDLNRSLRLGSFVYSGTVLGTLVNASPNSEIGWGVVGAAYTAEHSCYVEGCSTALGVNFNHLLVCLHTPSGVMEGGGCCPTSTGYPPDWCTPLSHWQ